MKIKPQAWQWNNNLINKRFISQKKSFRPLLPTWLSFGFVSQNISNHCNEDKENSHEHMEASHFIGLCQSLSKQMKSCENCSESNYSFQQKEWSNVFILVCWHFRQHYFSRLHLNTLTITLARSGGILPSHLIFLPVSVSLLQALKLILCSVFQLHCLVTLTSYHKHLHLQLSRKLNPTSANICQWE